MKTLLPRMDSSPSAEFVLGPVPSSVKGDATVCGL
jgi:hypothetical protein